MQNAIIAGIQVSRLCFGTLTMGPLQRNLSPQQGGELLVHAARLGVNFLDTAKLYDNYAHIAYALKAGAQYVVATKSYAYDEETAQEDFLHAVRGISREYIDFYLLHEQESEHTLRGHAQALEYLHKQRQKGFIRAVGVSTHFVRCVYAAADHPLVEVIHPLINQAGIGIADGTVQEMEAAIAYARGKGKYIYAMKALGGGHLIAQPKQAIQYVLQNANIASVAVGMQSNAEIEYNAALFSGQDIPAQAQQNISTQKRKLNIDFWCAGCGTCVQRCANKALSVVEGKAQADMGRCVLCGYCVTGCPQFCIKVI